MTVKALIEQLQLLMPEEADETVYRHHCRDCGGDEIGEVKVFDNGVELI